MGILAWVPISETCGKLTRGGLRMQNAIITPADGRNNPAAEIFTDETAAAYIGGVKARAVRDWRTKRGLPFIRVTSKVCRIRRADLDKWLAQHRVATMTGGAQ